MAHKLQDPDAFTAEDLPDLVRLAMAGKRLADAVRNGQDAVGEALAAWDEAQRPVSDP